MPENKRKKETVQPQARHEGDWAAGEVAFLTGGQDLSCAFGLATTLSQRGIRVHVVGNDRVGNIDFHTSSRITFVDCTGLQPNGGFLAKLLQLIAYYARLIAYATSAAYILITQARNEAQLLRLTLESTVRHTFRPRVHRWAGEQASGCVSVVQVVKVSSSSAASASPPLWRNDCEPCIRHN